MLQIFKDPKENAPDNPTVNGRIARRDFNARSQSDRRPTRYRNWDDPVNRRCLSLNLKSDRHSISSVASHDPVNVLHNVICATKEESAAKRLQIKYCPRLDEYRRPSDANSSRLKGEAIYSIELTHKLTVELTMSKSQLRMHARIENTDRNNKLARMFCCLHV